MFCRYYDIWNFTSFTFSRKIVYLDVIIIITIFNCLLLYNDKIYEKNDSNLGFFDDEPLGKDKIDELGYSTYANVLTERIQKSHFEKSFAIGVNGKWGSGKTSFIDLLKRNFEKNENFIELNFNPWNSNSPQAIIKDFFDTLQEGIGPYHSTLSRLLISYSAKLISLNDNKLAQSIQVSVMALTGFESVEKLYKEINKALKKVNKKFVIYIDDLDRLDNAEIIEVIRLIRNTANFHNIIFVVGYDRNYVVNALKNHNSYNHFHFLEKIFQVEITLPYYKSEILSAKLIEKLKIGIPTDFQNKIDLEILRSTGLNLGFLNNWLESMRDVTRLSNSLLLNLSMLWGEVDFIDFLKLELLRIKYPSVYELLFRYKQFFFDTAVGNSGIAYYKLISFEKMSRSWLNVNANVNDKAQYTTALEYYLYHNCNNLSLPSNQIKKVHDFIDSIFTDLNSFRFEEGTHLSVIFPSKFENYCSYNLFDDRLSEVAFSKARSLETEDFILQIDGWLSNLPVSEVVNRFAEIHHFDDLEDFKKIMSAIFYIGSTKSTNRFFIHRFVVGYDTNDLIGKIYRFQIYLKENNNYNDIKELRNFIKSLFEKAEHPFLFQAELIHDLSKRFQDDFLLNNIDLQNLIASYFFKYCEMSNKLDDGLWSLYNDVKKTVANISNNEGHTINGDIMEGVKESFIEFILRKDLDGFLKSMIQNIEREGKVFRIHKFVLELWEDWDDFRKILDDQDESKWKYLNEFKKFYDLSNETNHSLSMHFNFVDIPITK